MEDSERHNDPGSVPPEHPGKEWERPPTGWKVYGLDPGARPPDLEQPLDEVLAKFARAKYARPAGPPTSEQSWTHPLPPTPGPHTEYEFPEQSFEDNPPDAESWEGYETEGEDQQWYYPQRHLPSPLGPAKTVEERWEEIQAAEQESRGEDEPVEDDRA